MVFKRRTLDFLLHLNAQQETHKFARNLRKSSTHAEKLLWDELKGRKLAGLKFRRQHPIHYYIADFYCHEQRLIVEVDGKIHLKRDVKEHDQNRDAELTRLGIRILRFNNEEVTYKISSVKKKIITFIQSHPYK